MKKRIIKYISFVCYGVIGLANLLLPSILLKSSPILYENLKNKTAFYINYAICTVLFVLTLVIIYKVISIQKNEKEIKIENKKSSENFQAEFEKYNCLKDEYIELHKIKHDINNILNQAAILSEYDNLSNENAETLITSIKEEMSKLGELKTKE